MKKRKVEKYYKLFYFSTHFKEFGCVADAFSSFEDAIKYAKFLKDCAGCTNFVIEEYNVKEYIIETDEL